MCRCANQVRPLLENQHNGDCGQIFIVSKYLKVMNIDIQLIQSNSDGDICYFTVIHSGQRIIELNILLCNCMKPNNVYSLRLANSSVI